MNKYNESDVLNALHRKQDFLGSTTNEVYIRSTSNKKYVGDLGNKSQGKLDYLKKRDFKVFLVNDDEDYRKLIQSKK